MHEQRSSASIHIPTLAERLIARTWVRILLAALTYYTAGRLALLMAIPPGYATAVWPAAGLALVCCLFWGARVLPGIALGSFLVNVGTGFDSSDTSEIVKSIVVAVGIALGAATQALAGASLIRRFVESPMALAAERDIARFVSLGGPLACMVAPTVGVTTLCAGGGVIDWSNYGFSWWTWWVLRVGAQ